MGPDPLSIVIAAHDEALVIGVTLDGLLRDAASGEFEVVVAANGCRDDTAEVARARPGVRVLDRSEPGKVAALNAAEDLATGFPRLYLDADIQLTARDVRLLAQALGSGALAATGRRVVETTGRPWPVRSYYEVSDRLGWFDGHLYGRGAVMLSRRGRARFADFPAVLSDDLFLDQLFADDEKTEVAEVECRVAAPFTTRSLVRRLVRVRVGNADLRRGGDGDLQRPRPPREVAAACVDMVRRSPHLAPAVLSYLGLTVWVALRARLAREGVPWSQDRTTRVLAGP